MPGLDEGMPLFVQIAEQLADDIVDGVLAEGARVPSTNELAAFYRINPATAAKGINLLVDDGVLEKRRGIGMFVAAGAREQLRAAPPQAVRGAVPRPDAGRGHPAGHRHRHAGVPDPGTRLAQRRQQAMIPTISATALGRRYRDQTALDDVSLTVEPGTVTGLLGRNGAGKTTLMRIITGLEFPTAGDLRVFGQVPAENDAVLRRMVFVREEQAYPDLRVEPRDPGGLMVLPELE